MSDEDFEKFQLMRRKKKKRRRKKKKRFEITRLNKRSMLRRKRTNEGFAGGE
jgi:hypothetical protein